MYKSITKYLNAFSVTGRENHLAQLIESDMRPFCDDIKIDAMGNLICYKKGKDSSKRLMIASHMDEIGLVVTYIETNGYIRVSNVGGINTLATYAHAVVFENGTKGVVILPPNVKEDQKATDLLIDIGASNRKEASRKVKVGDVCAVTQCITKLGKNRLSAKALDDRICCCINYEVAAKNITPAYDTYYVFTVQEEVGCRGSKAASFDIKPDYAIALDVTPCGDVPGSTVLPVGLGLGAAIKVKDNSVICSAMLNDRLVSLANQAKIKWQYEVLTAGGTDTSSMQLSGSGAYASCISLPTRYVHTPVETIDLADFDACVDLLTAFIVEGI